MLVALLQGGEHEASYVGLACQPNGWSSQVFGTSTRLAEILGDPSGACADGCAGKLMSQWVVSSELDVDSLRAFARRDWSAVARVKEERRAARLRDDPMSAAHLAWAAYDYRCELHGEGVEPQRREADLAHHIRLNALLDRVAVALR